MKRIAVFTLLCASLVCASLVCASLLCTSLAYARDHQALQSGTLLQMESVNCGTDQKSDKSLAGEIVGTDNSHQKIHALLCQEYTLQTERLSYRIRPKDDQHPAVGDGRRRSYLQNFLPKFGLLRQILFVR